MTLPVPACGAQRQDKGIILLHCENAVFIVKIRWGIKGACMNHKYLHAINVWTKDLEWLRGEDFFSHEKRASSYSAYVISPRPLLI